jgi:hypothetical protein
LIAWSVVVWVLECPLEDSYSTPKSSTLCSVLHSLSTPYALRPRPTPYTRHAKGSRGAAGERDLQGMCESWLAFRREYAAAMYAYGIWLEERRGDRQGAEECYRIAVEHGRQRQHRMTREPFANNCREWFEAKDRVW